MLNMKKGLAIVLAAATALTFAPVASLSNGIQAEAANNSIGTSVPTLTVDDTISLHCGVNYAIKDGSTVKWHVASSDSSIVKLDTDADDVSNTDGSDTFTRKKGTGVGELWLKDGYNVKFTAKKAGSVTITYDYPDVNGTKIEKSFGITVKAKSTDAGFNIVNSAKDNATSNSDSLTVKKSDSKFLGITDKAQDNSYTYVIKSVASSDENVIAVTAPSGEEKAATLNPKKVGTATLTIVATQTHDDKTKDVTYTRAIKVVPDESTFKVDDKTIAAATYSAAPTDAIKTIYLTEKTPSAKIGATLADADANEKLVYKVFKDADANTYADKNSATATPDLTLKDDTVTATAAALNATEQYYDIQISNNLSAANEKVAVIRVITSRSEKAFTNLKLNLEGKDYTAAASFKADGTVEDKTDVAADLKLSTADKKSVPFTVTSTNQYTVTSNDPATVAVENGTLVAKKTGNAAITIATTPDTTHYGAAKITVTVSVTDQALQAKVVADPSVITLGRITKSAKISASVVTTPALTTQPALKYRFVTKTADGKYESANSADLTLGTDGTVTYKTTNKGTALVEVSADATTAYATPAVAIVTVNYSNDKEASKLNVTTKALNIKEGATGSIVATGTALSYKSSDETVATVAADGTVTGVKAGVAVITVTDAGNENVEGSSADVTVNVSKATATPAKVTGVKVSNKKGAYVKVTWKKDSNPNVKYYVKKTISGKSAGRSVAGNSATLKVKKGATVKVKVKAYVYDASGKKLVGTYSATVTKKTDKK
jgi:hypothetical protein